jgi:hypothetical protein
MGVVHRSPPSLVYFLFKLKIKGSFLVIATRGGRRRNLITFNSRHFTPNSIQMTDDVNIDSNKNKIVFIIESTWAVIIIAVVGHILNQTDIMVGHSERQLCWTKL